MLRIAYRLSRRIMLSALLLLIAGFAVLVTVGRIYLPQIADHQAAIVDQVEERTGLQLSFSSLRGEWRGLLPSIVVKDIELRSDVALVLEAEHIALSLALVRSFFSRRLVARSLSVVDAHLMLARSSEGRWGLAGLSAGQGAATVGHATVSRFIESLNLLELSQVGVSVHSSGQAHRVLESANLLMRRGLFLSQINLEVSSQQSADLKQGRTLLQLRGEIRGSLFSADAARAHLLVNDVSLPKLTRFLGPDVGWLPQGLSGRLWYDWSRASGWQLQGMLRADHWSLPGPGQQLAPLRSANLHVLAEGGKNVDIKGQFTDFTGSWNGAGFSVAGGRFRVPPSRRHVQLSLKALDLQSVVRGLSRPVVGQHAAGIAAEPVSMGGPAPQAGALLPDAVVSVLETMRPTGELQDLHMSVPLRRQSLKDFRLAARLQNVGFSAWNAVPALRQVDGFLSMSLDRGFVQLDGSSVELSFPKIFSHDLPFQGLTGRVHWKLGDDLQVSSSLLRGWGDFGAASADFSLNLPLRDREQRPPLLSLQLGVEDADTAFTERYTPHLLPANLRGWLYDSVRGGTIARGGLVYHGSVRRGEAHNRSVQLFAEVREGVLRYHPHWPQLTQLDGALLLADTALWAQIRRGAMLGSQLRQIDVELQPGSDFFQLRCNGDVRGPAQDLIALLDDTPLLSASSVSEWRARGNYSARVDLRLPLVANREPEVEVAGKLQRIDLEHSALGLEIGDINGAIDYRHGRGLRARELTATLWGQPVRAKIGPGPATASRGRSLRLQARAAVAPASVQRWLRQPALSMANGSSDWEARIDWPMGVSKAPPSLLLRSNLQGLAIALPPPFGKSAEQLRRVEVRTVLGESARSWRARYANLATAAFESGRRGVRGRVVLGAGATSGQGLPEQGVKISGQLQRLKVQDWLSIAERYQRLERVSGDRDGDRDGDRWRVAVDGLRVLELDLFGQVLRRPVLDLSMLERRWQLRWRHPRTAGRLRLPVPGEPYQFELERLYLPLAGASLKLLETTSAGGLLAGIDPGSLPHTRVHIKDLKFDQQPLGQWSFTTVPGQHRLLVNDIRVRLGDASFSGSGRHHRGARLSWSLNSGGGHRTELLGLLRTTDVNQLLGEFGYDAGIVSESGRLGVNLQWSGAPDQLALPQLSGELSLKLTDGQLYQTVGTPAEALRILGILNVNYLARRLRLDFSDLYKAGLSYDRIQGRLRLREGRMQLDEPLVVSGPSSQLTMRGDFDLDGNEIDAELVVSLPLTGDLPWIVALALPGGVPIAAGVYVAGRLFEQQLESLTSAVYHISGSLDDPDVKFKHLADAGAAKENGVPEAVTRARGRRAHGGARR